MKTAVSFRKYERYVKGILCREDKNESAQDCARAVLPLRLLLARFRKSEVRKRIAAATKEYAVRIYMEIGDQRGSARKSEDLRVTILEISLSLLLLDSAGERRLYCKSKESVARRTAMGLSRSARGNLVRRRKVSCAIRAGQVAT